jgi:hypothetical protein
MISRNVQKYISPDMDRVIRKHQRSLQSQNNFIKGKKSKKITYIKASRDLAKLINGGARL